MIDLLIGLAGGFFGGLVGLGGGVIMIPLMVSIGKLTQHQAHGTSLVAVVFTGMAGAAAYLFHNAVDWRASVVLALSATATARFGAHYAYSLPEKNLKKAFGAFLIFVSALILVKAYLPEDTSSISLLTKIVVLLLTGAGTGFLSGMMGVGGGTVMIPAMVLFAAMDQHTAQGSSLLAMVPVGISGALAHYKLGNVKAGMLTGLIAGAVIGSYLGGTAANVLPELYLKFVFAIILTWLGLRYLGVKLLG
jgi:uncharacterized membrane protein YfcA